MLASECQGVIDRGTRLVRVRRYVFGYFDVH